LVGTLPGAQRPDVTTQRPEPTLTSLLDKRHSVGYVLYSEGEQSVAMMNAECEHPVAPLPDLYTFG